MTKLTRFPFFFLFFFHEGSACTLVFNLLSSLAMFCVDTNNGVGFGLAILWLLLFTPCSFVCWYRPVYKAFRSVAASRSASQHVFHVLSLAE